MCTIFHSTLATTGGRRKIKRRGFLVISKCHVFVTASPPFLKRNITGKKVDELTVCAASADIVAITEAWQIVPEVCSVDNYQRFHHLRKRHRRGGVALFYRSALCPFTTQC